MVRQANPLSFLFDEWYSKITTLALFVLLAYQPPDNNTFPSEQISHQQPTSSSLLASQC
jgi:hypothetical protein